MHARDWTTTSAKWAAVLVLGGASIAGMAWSFSRPRVVIVHAPPQPAQSPVPAPAPAMQVERPPAPPPPREGHADAPRPAAVESFTPPEDPPPTLQPGHSINLNTASRAELELLPGIGPALAQRIIDHREAKGRFATVDSLDDVKGIGPKILERLRPLVRVD